MKIVSAFITLVVGLPIWLYLQYQVLVRVEASELMWFLFWVYLPAVILAGIVGKLAEQS